MTVSAAPEYIRATEAFKILGPAAFSIQTLQRLADTGEIRAIRMPTGRRDRKYLRADIEALRDRMHAAADVEKAS